MHNTVGPLRANGQALAGYPDQSTAQYKSDMTGTVIRNNLFRASSWDVGTDPPPTKDHNVEPATDPKFVDEANHNFQLREGSPAIDAGVATPFTGEFAGKAPDCGAFEFGMIAWVAGYSPPGPKPPRIGRIGDKTITVNQFLAFSVSMIEPDGDPVTYAADPVPAGATFDPQTGIFSWTPVPAQAGTYAITFTASDKDGSDSQTITITVNSVMDPPDDFIAYWTFDGTTADEARNLNGVATPGLSYADGKSGLATVCGSAAYVTVPGGPVLNTLDELTVTAWINPAIDISEKPILSLYASPTDRIYFRVSGTSKLRVFNDVADVGIGHDSDSISGLAGAWFFVAWSYGAGGLSRVYVNGEPSGVPKQYSVSLAGLPRGFTAYIGYEPFIPFAFNGLIDEMMLFDRELTADEVRCIYRNPGLAAPIMHTVGEFAVREGCWLVFTLPASRPVGRTLTFNAADLPADASLDSSTGVFRWVPGSTQAGVHTIPFEVSDGAASDSANARIIVQNDPIGDANDDCTVDVLDLIAVQRLAGRDPTLGQNWKADLNQDGRIDADDLVIIRERLGRTCHR